MIMNKSAEFNIYLNAKDRYGQTAFYKACKEGQSKIAEMIIKKSGELNGDVYTGKETVEYLASGVPDRVFFAIMSLLKIAELAKPLDKIVRMKR